MNSSAWLCNKEVLHFTSLSWFQILILFLDEDIMADLQPHAFFLSLFFQTNKQNQTKNKQKKRIIYNTKIAAQNLPTIVCKM